MKLKRDPKYDFLYMAAEYLAATNLGQCPKSYGMQVTDVPSLRSFLSKCRMTLIDMEGDVEEEIWDWKKELQKGDVYCLNTIQKELPFLMES